MKKIFVLFIVITSILLFNSARKIYVVNEESFIKDLYREMKPMQEAIIKALIFDPYEGELYYDLNRFNVVTDEYFKLIDKMRELYPYNGITIYKGSKISVSQGIYGWGWGYHVDGEYADFDNTKRAYNTDTENSNKTYWLFRTYKDNLKYFTDMFGKKLRAEYYLKYGWVAYKNGPIEIINEFNDYEVPVKICIRLSVLDNKGMHYAKNLISYTDWGSMKKLLQKRNNNNTKDNNDIATKIKKLKELYDSDILTKDEYEKKKKELLDKM